jgi:hypothetical protein
MTAVATIYVDQGMDFSMTLDLYDAVGDGFQITDQQFKMEVRKLYSAPVLFEAVIEINENDSQTNNLDIKIPAEVTEGKAPGKYRYDLIMLDTNDGTRVKLLEGLLFLSPTISTFG